MWRWVRPPASGESRRLVGLVCLAIALPRVGMPWAMRPFQLPGVAVGWALLALGLGLAVTSGRLRRHWSGRVVAVLGFACFATLAWDAWGASLTSGLISLVLAWALLGEAGA